MAGKIQFDSSINNGRRQVLAATSFHSLLQQDPGPSSLERDLLDAALKAVPQADWDHYGSIVACLKKYEDKDGNIIPLTTNDMAQEAISLFNEATAARKDITSKYGKALEGLNINKKDADHRLQSDPRLEQKFIGKLRDAWHPIGE